LFTIDSGFVAMEIANCNPQESNLLNNTDTLFFNTVVRLKASLTVSNLNLAGALPSELPGWIGGKIILGNSDLTVIGNIINFDTAHFIVTDGTGRLRIVNGNPENIFPVGTSLVSSNFLRLRNNGTADNFRVRVAPFVLSNGNTGDTVRTGNVSRTWFIDEDVSGGSDAVLEMYWFPNHEADGFDRSKSRMGHFTGTWELGNPTAAVLDSANGQFSKRDSGFTSFSPFTVTNESPGLLPLTFLDFYGTKKLGSVHLTWRTMAETGTSHFIVEHATNGMAFRPLSSLAALGNTGTVNIYTYQHQSPVEGINYYRIKQIDQNGAFTYSKIIRISYSEANNAVLLYPNPVGEVLNVMLPAQNIRPLSCRIINSSGQVVQEHQGTAANAIQVINTSKLPSGQYWLVVVSGQQVTHHKFIKL